LRADSVGGSFSPPPSALTYCFSPKIRRLAALRYAPRPPFQSSGEDPWFLHLPSDSWCRFLIPDPSFSPPSPHFIDFLVCLSLKGAVVTTHVILSPRPCPPPICPARFALAYFYSPSPIFTTSPYTPFPPPRGLTGTDLNRAARPRVREGSSLGNPNVRTGRA